MNLRKRVPQQSTTSSKKQQVQEPSAQENKSGREFEVEKILNKKIVKGRVRYFLKWKGYSNSYNSWEDKSSLNCSLLIKEFEKKLKKESKQKADKENIKGKRNGANVPVKKNVKESKNIHSVYCGSRKNSLDDFVVNNDSYEKHTRFKGSQLNEHEIIKKRHFNDSHKKHTRLKGSELSEHEIIKKRHDNDCREKSTKMKNAELKKHEVVKEKHYNDLGAKYAYKTAVPNGHEIVKKRQNDLGTKHACKNVESNEHGNLKKRHNDYKTKHTIKNVEPNEHEIIKRRHDAGLSRKEPEVARSSSRNRRQIPKIQNLQYYVKSTNFPKKRKNGVLSVMRVSFQGADVLKGLNHFIEAGIAAGPLPDYLYDKPIKTGATEFQFTV